MSVQPSLFNMFIPLLYISMEIKHKELYERPTTDAVEVQTEGVICQSVKTTYNPMGGEEEWTF